MCVCRGAGREVFAQEWSLWLRRCSAAYLLSLPATPCCCLLPTLAGVACRLQLAHPSSLCAQLATRDAKEATHREMEALARLETVEHVRGGGLQAPREQSCASPFWQLRQSPAAPLKHA